LLRSLVSWLGWRSGYTLLHLQTTLRHCTSEWRAHAHVLPTAASLCDQWPSWPTLVMCRRACRKRSALGWEWVGHSVHTRPRAHMHVLSCMLIRLCVPSPTHPHSIAHPHPSNHTHPTTPIPHARTHARTHAHVTHALDRLQEGYGKSMWLPTSEAGHPTCGLERLAAAVLSIHDPTGSAAGVEWWVQIRGPATNHGDAIGFHWDRDEVLADADPPTLAHPMVATVTYLTSAGAPTVVLDVAPLQLPGTASATRGYVSHPSPGKHIAFDGRLLHGVPPELELPRPPGEVLAWLNGCRAVLLLEISTRHIFCLCFFHSLFCVCMLFIFSFLCGWSCRWFRYPSVAVTCNCWCWWWWWWWRQRSHVVTTPNRARAATGPPAKPPRGHRLTFLANVWTDGPPAGIARLDSAAAAAMSVAPQDIDQLLGKGGREGAHAHALPPPTHTHPPPTHPPTHFVFCPYAAWARVKLTYGYSVRCTLQMILVQLPIISLVACFWKACVAFMHTGYLSLPSCLVCKFHSLLACV
jgi:hypothetical protein